MDLWKKFGVKALAFGFVVGLLFISYYHGLSGPFLLDDFTSVMPAKVTELTFSELWRVSLGDGSGIFGRAIPVFTFALNHHFLVGDSAFAFKVVNLFIHVLNFLLAYWFLFLLARSSFTERFSFSVVEARWLALACAAIWALHPLQVSTVMYVVQRMTMLSTTFCLCALIVYLKYRGSVQKSSHLVAWIGAISTFTLLSCLSKENGVLIILYIGLIEVCLFPQSVKRAIEKLRFVDVRILYTSIILAAGAVFYTLTRLMSSYALRDFGLFERVLTQPLVLVFYLKNIFLPDLNAMSIYHDGFEAVTQVDTAFFKAIAVLFSFVVLAAISWRRMPFVSIGIGLYFISHLLESTVLPLELVFEHRNYIGILGLVLAVIFGGWFLFRSYVKRTAILALLVVMPVLFLAQQTYSRSIEWSSKETLLRAGIENKSNSLRVKMAVTEGLAGTGRLEELLVHLDSSIRAHPQHSLFSVQKVMFTGALGRKDPLALRLAIDGLSTLPLRTTDLKGLNELYKFRSAGRFQWPSMEEVVEMFAAAKENKNTRIRPATKVGLDRVYLQLLADLES